MLRVLSALENLGVSTSLKRKLLNGGFWALTTKMLTMLTTLAINAILTRLLAPEDVGGYFLIFSIINAATFFAQAGLGWTIMKIIADSMANDKPARARKAIISTIIISSITAILFSLVLGFGGTNWIARNLFKSEIVGQASVYISVLVVFRVMQNVFVEIQRGFHDIRLFSLLGNFGANVILLILLVTSYFFINSIQQVNNILALVMFSYLALLIISTFFLTKKVSSLPKKTSDLTPQNIWATSSGMWGTQVLLFIWSQSDIWIVGSFRPSQDVAIYGAAIRLIGLVNIPSIILNSVLPPIISQLSSQKRTRELERILRTATTITAFPSAMILAVLAILATDVLEILFGTYYRASAPILIVLSIGQLVNVAAGSCGELLLFTGNQGSMMKISGFSAAVTIVTSLTLVQIWGNLGVAIAVVIGMTLQNVLAIIESKKRLDIWTYAYFNVKHFFTGFAK